MKLHNWESSISDEITQLEIFNLWWNYTVKSLQSLMKSHNWELSILNEIIQLRALNLQWNYIIKSSQPSLIKQCLTSLCWQSNVWHHFINKVMLNDDCLCFKSFDVKRYRSLNSKWRWILINKWWWLF